MPITPPPMIGAAFPVGGRFTLPTFAKPTDGTPADALMFVRRNRHTPDCRCGKWRDNTGAPFCTPAEALWSRALNRLLSSSPEESDA